MSSHLPELLFDAVFMLQPSVHLYLAYSPVYPTVREMLGLSLTWYTPLHEDTKTERQTSPFMEKKFNLFPFRTVKKYFRYKI